MGLFGKDKDVVMNEEVEFMCQFCVCGDFYSDGHYSLFHSFKPTSLALAAKEFAGKPWSPTKEQYSSGDIALGQGGMANSTATIPTTTTFHVKTKDQLSQSRSQLDKKRFQAEYQTALDQHNLLLKQQMDVVERLKGDVAKAMVKRDEDKKVFEQESLVVYEQHQQQQQQLDGTHSINRDHM